MQPGRQTRGRWWLLGLAQAVLACAAWAGPPSSAAAPPEAPSGTQPAGAAEHGAELTAPHAGPAVAEPAFAPGAGGPVRDLWPTTQPAPPEDPEAQAALLADFETIRREALPGLPLSTAEEQADAVAPAVRVTPHFYIATDTAGTVLPDRIEATVENVERWAQALRLPTHPLQRRMELMYFNSYSDYLRAAARAGLDGQGTYGFYDEVGNRGYFFNLEHEPAYAELRRRMREKREELGTLRQAVRATVPPGQGLRLALGSQPARDYSRDELTALITQRQAELRQLNVRVRARAETLLTTVIQHEVAHQVLFNVGIQTRGASNPVWLTEGLAMQFETPPDHRGAGDVVLNTRRAADALAALRAGQLFPLEALVGTDGPFRQPGPARGYAYAQAWSLVWFLKSDFRSDFAAYVEAIGSRRRGERVTFQQERELFERHFGPINRLEPHWRAALERLKTAR